METTYLNDIIQNTGYGISGLTQRQTLTGASTILDAIERGGIQSLLFDNEQEVLDAYMSAYENMPAYVSMAQAIEGITDESGNSMGYRIRDLVGMSDDSPEYEKINETLLKLGYSAEDAQRVMKDLDQEIFVGGVTALNLYGDATEQVTESM